MYIRQACRMNQVFQNERPQEPHQVWIAFVPPNMIWERHLKNLPRGNSHNRTVNDLQAL